MCSFTMVPTEHLTLNSVQYTCLELVKTFSILTDSSLNTSLHIYTQAFFELLRKPLAFGQCFFPLLAKKTFFCCLRHFLVFSSNHSTF